jgi:hypothetical protein
MRADAAGALGGAQRGRQLERVRGPARTGSHPSTDAHLSGPDASTLDAATLLALRAQDLRWTLHTPAHRYSPVFFELAEQVTVHPASRGQRRSPRWSSAAQLHGRTVAHTTLPLE